MPLLRPWLILDTNICIEVTKRNGAIPRSEWIGVGRFIRRHYRYCISWVTWKELLVRLARGAPEFFGQNKEPLRVLRGQGAARLLEKPPIFAIRRVLGIDVSDTTDVDGLPVPEYQEYASDVLKAVTVAPSKAALKHGVKLPGTRRTCLSFDHYCPAIS
jgi:hypothetical protein